MIIAGSLGIDIQQEQGYNNKDSIEFNENDFIRLGRRGRRPTRDDKDELIIAGGLGTDI